MNGRGNRPLELILASIGGRFNARSPPEPLHFCKALSETTHLPPVARTAPFARKVAAFSPDILATLLIATITFSYVLGLSAVPFHPDESTQLYMSADFEAMISNPATLAWDAARSADPRQEYRLLDAPVTRLLLGMGRSLAGFTPPAADWDWSLSWDENARRGALPDPRMLWVGRLALVALFPLSLACLYGATRALSGRLGGIVAIFLLGTHTLVLLHTRRAMAEAALLLGVTSILASLPGGYRRPWLVGLAFALAFNAKQSSLALLPAGLLAVTWLPAEVPGRLFLAMRNTAQFLGIFALLTLALNPVLWGDPFGAARAAWQARRALLDRQTADVRRLVPEQVLETPGERAAGLLAHLYIAPPVFAEAGNYQAATAGSEAAYLTFPLNNIWRGPLGAGLLLGATLLGFVWVARVAWIDPSRRKVFLLFLLAEGFQAAGLVAAVPLPWQRYSLPLVPFICLMAACGFAWVIRWFSSPGGGMR